MIDRRSFLQLALAAQAFAAFPARASTPGLHMGEPQPFSYDWLKSHAQALAAADYTPPPRPDPKIVSSIDYDAHGQLHYKIGLRAFWRRRPGRLSDHLPACGDVFPQDRAHVRRRAGRRAGGCPRNPLRSQLFHHSARKRRGAIARKPIAHGGLLGAGAQRPAPRIGARPSPGSRSWALPISAPKASLARSGMSARGIALTPGGSSPEEFPDFVGFWFMPAPAASKSVTVFALLDGPSVAGAYRFVMERTKGVVMEIEATLFFRQAVERLGLAPLTTMYWYSETVKRAGIDWRPEVHDSDGLAMWTGGGEHIWRPLNNPAHIYRIGLPGRASARVRPFAARPQFRPLSGRRRLREAAFHLGRAYRRLGQGHRPAR